MRPAAAALIVSLPLAATTLRQAPPATEGGWITDTARVAGTATASGIALESGMAYRPDWTLGDGTIELRLGEPTGAFAGVAFRMSSSSDYDIIYFNATSDGDRWAGLQYQPVFQGETTWQLYYRDGYRATLPATTSRTPHVRIVIAGGRADVFVDEAAQPVLRVPALKRDAQPGHVGVWSAGGPSGTSVLFSDLRIDAHRVPLPEVASQETASDGQLVRWRLSDRMDAPGGVRAPRALPATLDWRHARVADAERDGTVNLTKVIGNSAGPQRVNVFGGAGWGLAYAETVLVSDRAARVPLSLAYSDGVGVYLNGERLYAGDNSIDSRYPGSLGAIGGENDTVDLPLRAGRNELVLCVTDKAFGWGFKARLDRGDVKIRIE